MNMLSDHTNGPLQKGVRVLVDGKHPGIIEKWCGGRDYVVMANVTEGKETHKRRLAIGADRITVLDASKTRPGVVTK